MFKYLQTCLICFVLHVNKNVYFELTDSLEYELWHQFPQVVGKNVWVQSHVPLVSLSQIASDLSYMEFSCLFI